jgi:hypothetical protein
MTALAFGSSTYKWDFERYAMSFVLNESDKRVLCFISGEALYGYFGAPLDSREGMEAAFLAHRERIETKALQMYRAGQVDAEGRVRLRLADFRSSQG